MNFWKQILVSPATSIREVIRVLDSGSLQIVLVVDPQERLLGTVTDGDIRRGILRGTNLDEPAHKIMNPDPILALVDDEPEQLLALMQRTRLHHIPVVDTDRRVVGLQLIDELIERKQKNNIVVLMAGGLGSRLRPLTDDCPKPMLKVGNKPLLETIIESFSQYGFRRFYISVNYMADKVKDHFGDGKRWGVSINYLHEDQQLGTAGALSLIEEKSDLPLIVMNSDILTKVNFQHLLDFHAAHQAVATMCVREYDFQVPYGVVKIEHHRIVGIEEKPVHRFFVNAGIYVLDPAVLASIPKNSFFDMPSLYQGLIGEGKETAVFPVREYWLDIGHIADFDRANGEFAGIFS